MDIERLPSKNGNCAPALWLVIDAGYLINDAEKDFPDWDDGFIFDDIGDEYKYPAPAILNGTDEVKMCNAGYPVLAIKKPDKETIIII